MNALPEFWAAILGWLDLIAGRKDAGDKFNLSRAGLANAIGAYFAIVLLSLVVATAMGQNPGIVGGLVGIVFNAVPLAAIWLVILGTAAALRPASGALALLVPATYAMALIFAIRVPLEVLAPTLLVVAPENAKILLDGQPLSNTRDPRELAPGDHTIQFTIGDYELTRKIQAEKGKTYTVSMLIDVTIEESP
ncbi:MAG TPA: hypothetical protein PLU93_11095 [Treponemataceae bacterium]|nr:hypothetical protein [Treponemataceae bacterium]